MGEKRAGGDNPCICRTAGLMALELTSAEAGKQQGWDLFEVQKENQWKKPPQSPRDQALI